MQENTKRMGYTITCDVYFKRQTRVRRYKYDQANAFLDIAIKSRKELSQCAKNII